MGSFVDLLHLDRCIGLMRDAFALVATGATIGLEILTQRSDVEVV
jgi:hypothetical protein